MNKFYLSIAIFAMFSMAFGSPNIRVPRQAEDTSASGEVEYDEAQEDQPLGLPSNSTGIRANIVDTFSCEGRPYGYYADIDNQCQVFHVCLPATFPDGSEKTYKWSFICPAETIFSQDTFTCTRTDDAIPCEESAQFYSLNDDFGKIPEKSSNEAA